LRILSKFFISVLFFDRFLTFFIGHGYERMWKMYRFQTILIELLIPSSLLGRVLLEKTIKKTIKYIITYGHAYHF